jgi:hypothetical protein
MHATTGADTPRRGLARWKVDVLIALAILCISGPIIQRWTAQPASRYALTIAVVDDHSLRIDPYVGVLGIDRARFEGHTYSDKAPYQPFLAVPAYAAFRAAGGHPFPVVDGKQVINRSTHVGLWWVTLWSATVPAILLALAMRRLVKQVDPRLATTVALAMALGTTILPFSSWLFGHVLAALCVTVAWALLRRSPPTARAGLLGGLALGAGIGTEYTVAVIALILLIDVARQRAWLGAVWLSVGTVAGAVPLFLYNWLVFRNPFEVSYQGHLPNFQGSGALGVFNLTLPQPDEISRALVSDRGLFVLTPIALLAVIGCVLAVLRGDSTRRDGWIGLASLVAFIVVSTGIDGLGGDSPGPRYLIPMFPLLAVPLVTMWRRFPLVCLAATAVGALTMWVATVTDPAIASTAPNALGTWVQRLGDGELVPNILTGRDHRWVLFVTTAVGVALALAAVRASRDEDVPSPA